MKITDIVKAKGSRYTIFVDDEYWYILDLEIIMANGLKISTKVDEDFLEDLMMQAERRKARERAYYLLGYRDHSKKELYDKLLKSARPQIAMDIIIMVEEQGLLNDEDYAGKLARYYMLSKKWGAKKAYYEMLKRGIDKELILSAIDECDVDFVEQIKEIIDKKYYDCLEDYKGKQKLIAALMRLGYAYDDIKTAISEYN
ncbi:MAG: regulatory protein RecX [Oscillospiraceae bacterium]